MQSVTPKEWQQRHRCEEKNRVRASKIKTELKRTSKIFSAPLINKGSSGNHWDFLCVYSRIYKSQMGFTFCTLICRPSAVFLLQQTKSEGSLFQEGGRREEGGREEGGGREGRERREAAMMHLPIRQKWFATACLR